MMVHVSWLRKVWQRLGPRRKVVVCASESPLNKIGSRNLYLMRDGGEDWSVSFLCPCGCRDRIELLLIQEATPHWRINIAGAAAPTLYPSVYKKSGCKSHFWIQKGHVLWVD